MATSEDRMLAIRKFVEDWRGRGQEDKHDQTFWNQFLQDVMGIARVHHEIDYQKRVRVGQTTKKIDGYIPSSKVLIEQKSFGTDLTKPQVQSDGMPLTPFEQALRYAQNLPRSETPDYIIVSNFESFWVYDIREDFSHDPVVVALEELSQQLSVFDFIIGRISEKIEREQQVNQEAAKLIGDLYQEIAKRYPDPAAARHDLAILMVRILFCLYAEDSGLFNQGWFSNYLERHSHNPTEFRDSLIHVFNVLSKSDEERKIDLSIDDALVQFPYVNGGLFEGEIQIPQMTTEIALKLIVDTARHFNWQDISPVIFGSIFESILSGDERRAGGMHYTSVENIHKVIDPLFLDDLRSELNQAGNHKQKLIQLQDKMASLKFLDPACGSGNFLTQAYLDLRELENTIIERLLAADSEHGQTGLDVNEQSFVKVNVGQFFGIEINDFAVSVANTALWIADHRANLQTSNILNRPIVNLPLKKYDHIICENALRFEWGKLLPAGECNYVMGNPPFIGASNCTAEQKQEIVDLYGKIKLSNSLDFVAGWYYKASEMMMENPNIKAALVSTNSITQGEQVAPLWGTLFERFDIHIDFAWRTFIWDSEATDKAHVHCVIIGFSKCGEGEKIIFSGDDQRAAQNISPYLIDAPSVLVSSHSKPVQTDTPVMVTGTKPTDGGWYLFTEEEMLDFLKAEPDSKQYFRRWLGAEEFINGTQRYCLYLKGANPSVIAKLPSVKKRIEAVRNVRLGTGPNKKGQLATKRPPQPTIQAADRPTEFFFDSVQSENYLLIPSTSSERRPYAPIGFMSPDTIASNATQVIPNASRYAFGILNSQFHNAWLRTVGGRLKSDYRYTPSLVYNTFIWPDATDEQRAEIERLAQAVLDARANYPESSLADLYDPLTMPLDLLKAHKALDKAVERAYGVRFSGNEEKIVAHLFKLYAEETNK